MKDAVVVSTVRIQVESVVSVSAVLYVAVTSTALYSTVIEFVVAHVVSLRSKGRK